MMEDDSKKFFDGLAHGAPQDNERIIDQEFPGEDATQIEPTLVKSGASSVTVRQSRARSVKPVDAEEVPIQEGAMFDEGEGQLAIDIYQSPDEIVIQSTIAGVSPEDLEIHITNEAVSIRGVRHKEEEVREEDYYYQECYWGKFSRSIILPQEIDSDRATADLKNGVLTIRLPKINRQRAKKLRVRGS